MTIGTLKKNIQNRADSMSKYMCTHVYICLYSAVSLFLKSYFDINILPNYLIANFGITIFVLGLGLLFYPALLWFMLTLVFKNIQPIVTIPFFILFVVFQLIILFYSIMFGIASLP